MKTEATTILGSLVNENLHIEKVNKNRIICANRVTKLFAIKIDPPITSPSSLVQRMQGDRYIESTVTIDVYTGSG